MNTVILYMMGLASLVVLIAGAFFLMALIIYGIQIVWSKISACASNTKEYLVNKRDFELYKRDFDCWEREKRASVMRCRKCEYRRKVLEEEANHDE